MPTINIYHQKEIIKKSELTADLKKYVSSLLSVDELSLDGGHVSVRFISVFGDGMLGDIELEIKAHSFSERVERQDIFCKSIKDYIEGKFNDLGDVCVLLQLSELGHDII